MEELDVSVIILTYNEEIHIRRCIENVHSFVKDVFVIDSYSTDKTLQIANEFEKVTVLQNKWENNYAKQFNWGLEHAPVQSKWVLRLDADEYLLPELINELSDKLPFLLRMFRYDKAVCEQRLMDEHIQLLEGTTVDFKGDFVDHNLNNLSWFCNKHVGYAVREAADLLDIELDLYGVSQSDDQKNLTAQAMDKRRIKHRYVHMALFWRAFIYFCYRYFFKGGFLDGKEGFLWHFLQGWWYRTLVDAKVFEIKRACGMDREKIRKYLNDVYNCRQVESSNNK